MVRPLPSGGLAFQAAAGRWSMRSWLIRLFVLKALSRAVGSEGANVFCMARSRKLKFTHGTQPRNLLRRSSLLHKLGGLARGLLGWGFAPRRFFSSYSL